MPACSKPDRVVSLQSAGLADAAVMNLDKRQVATALAKYLVNPPVKLLAGRRLWPFHALLETRGRTSGRRRVTPVGNGLQGDSFWIVAEHGRRAGYVRNIQADPRVRVKIGGRWRTGVAYVMPDDDARQRQRRLGRPFNAAIVRLMGTDPTTVRIELEPR
jgi:deazaflavin-dependent oxidoreductase (nitroreductase family)